jgi:choice-of-anchor A domain-containing protein
LGGTGNTGDPAGGTGNTGDPAGGTGNTGDPAGGTGNTGDPAGGTGNTGDPVCVPTEMENINVIVFNDANPTGADSEGGMYVGHNLTANEYSISGKAGLTCSDWGLVVGNSIIGKAIVGSGKVAYTNSKGSTTATCGTYRATPVDFPKLEAKFISYSEAFKKLANTGSVTGSLVLSGADTKLNVFTVTGAQLAAASEIKFDVPVSSSVVVNVSGTAIDWENKGFVLADGGKSCRGGTSTWCGHIMWNFYEATSIVLSGIGVQGSILAPYATQSGGGGNVDGQVIVKNLEGGIEYHPYYFSGCLYL